MSKPYLVVLTRAGISAESGLETFRDSGGLWEGLKITPAESPAAEGIKRLTGLLRRDPGEGSRPG
jgi:NAD-dependent deacetylase